MLLSDWAVHRANVLSWSKAESSVAPWHVWIMGHVRGGKDMSSLIAQVPVVLLRDLELLGRRGSKSRVSHGAVLIQSSHRLLLPRRVTLRRHGLSLVWRGHRVLGHLVLLILILIAAADWSAWTGPAQHGHSICLINQLRMMLTEVLILKRIQALVVVIAESEAGGGARARNLEFVHDFLP